MRNCQSELGGRPYGGTHSYVVKGQAEAGRHGESVVPVVISVTAASTALTTCSMSYGFPMISSASVRSPSRESSALLLVVVTTTRRERMKSVFINSSRARPVLDVREADVVNEHLRIVLSHELDEIQLSTFDLVDVRRHHRAEAVMLKHLAQHVDGVLTAVDDGDNSRVLVHGRRFKQGHNDVSGSS